MPELGQIAGAFIAAIFALTAWRYVERLLGWLELQTGKRASRFASIARRFVASRWGILLWWTGVVTVAALVGWLSDYRSGLILFGGFAGGMVLSWAEDRGWIRGGLTAAVAGIGMLVGSLALAVRFALTMEPMAAFAAVFMGAGGVLAARIGVRILRGDDDSLGWPE